MREGACGEPPPLFRDGVVVGVETFIMTLLHREALVNVSPLLLQANKGDHPALLAAGACRGQGRGIWQSASDRRVLSEAP